MITLDGEIPPGYSKYKTTPVFTQDTLPAGLQKNHKTKPGIFAKATVLTGSIVYNLERDPDHNVTIRVGQHVIIEPEIPHHVKLCGPVQLQLEFYRKA